MARSFNPTALISPGVVMESVDNTGTAVVTKVQSSTSVGDCPGCGSTSRRAHSRYTRILADLPLSGCVQPQLLVRRFRCDRALCTRRIFSERLAAAISWARRTARLDEIVHHFGLALGSRPTASFAQRLRLPAAFDFQAGISELQVTNAEVIRILRVRAEQKVSSGSRPPQYHIT